MMITVYFVTKHTQVVHRTCDNQKMLRSVKQYWNESDLRLGYVP